MNAKEDRRLRLEKEQKGYDQISDEINILQNKLAIKKKNLEKLKWELNHPYFDALHEALYSIYIARICMSYINEDFCVSCYNLYWGSNCVNCFNSIDESWLILSSYVIRDDWRTIKCNNTYADRVCFEPAHLDDVALLNYWHKLLNDKSFDMPSFIFCEKESSLHLTSSNRRQSIKKGNKLNLWCMRRIDRYSIEI